MQPVNKELNDVIIVYSNNESIIGFIEDISYVTGVPCYIRRFTENEPIDLLPPDNNAYGLVLFDKNNGILPSDFFCENTLKNPQWKNFYFLAIVHEKRFIETSFKFGFIDYLPFPAGADEWKHRMSNYIKMSHLEFSCSEKNNENNVEIIEEKKSSKSDADKDFFQFILDVIPIPIFYMSSDEKVEFCNNAFEVYHGLSSADIIGKNPYHYYPQEIALHLCEQDKGLIQEQSSQIYEYYAWHADSTLHHVIYYKSYAQIPFQNARGVVGAIFDITERKNSEKEKEILLEKIKSAYEELKELTELKDNFLSVASHDLRAPFNAILGYTDILLEDEELNETQRSYVDFIQQSAEIQLRYVNDILNIIRIEKGNLSIELENFPISEVVRNCIMNLKVLAEAKNITINQEIHFDGECYIDLPKITQVINNLISNAIKFTMPGGNINVKVISAPDDFIEIHVIDNGIGIPQAAQKKLFNYYRQEHVKGTSGESGHGLGLAICKNFIELHGGKIYLESETGKGSDFYFSLPLYPVAESFIEEETSVEL